jgi:uncharacterized protein (DUF4415 family)
MKAKAKKQTRQIAALTRLPDAKIDTSDIGERKDWSRAVVGKFYRPIKKPVTIRLDADLLAWLKSQGRGYQSRINHLLREIMHESGGRHRRAGRRR